MNSLDNGLLRPFKPYPAYKPSGVEWLGEIPAHWEVKRLKYLSSLAGLYGANISASLYSNEGVRFIRTTDISDDGQLTSEGVFAPEELVQDYILKDGDILLSRSGTIGRSFLYDQNLHGRCAYAGYLVRFVLNESVNPQYVTLFTRSTAFESYVRSIAISSTIDNVNADRYSNSLFPLPPLSEQRAIAAFLDRETARSDALVSREERLIELLREKRTALITRAVTRGLDPNAPLRDSGVEWLGEIPIHWETTKLRRLLTLVSHHVDVHPEQSYQEIGIRSWGRGIFHKDSVTGAQLGDKRVFKLRPGELVLNIVFAWEGAVAIVSESEKDMIASHRFPTFQHPRHLVDLDYLLMFLQSEHGRGIMGLNSPGAAGRNRTIRMDSFLEEEVPLPPLEEQREIVTIFRRDERRIQSLAGKVREAVDLLKELRTALITAAVTGRIDVREEVG